MTVSNLITPIVGVSGAGLGEQPPFVGQATTTDATETTIIEIAVAEGQAVRIEAWITARKSDGVKIGSWHLAGLFYRNTGGNVTLEGTVQDVASFLSATASWAVDMEADTTSQRIDVNVTGAAGETIEWQARTNSTVEG